MSTLGSVRTTVIEAHYARVMASADAARARAQAAYGIASAIAVALVAAGLFGSLDARPPAVQALAVAALVAWLTAAALFLHTVSSPFATGLEPKSSEDLLARAVLDGVRDEQSRIDGWQRWAQLAAALAALLTVAAFVSALRTDHGQANETATIVLSPTTAARLQAACGPIPATLPVRVASEDLNGKFVEMTLAPGVCGDGSVDVAVPRSAVLAVAFRSPPGR